MKKIFGLLTFSIILNACQDDVTFNNPGYQATINNEIWKSNSSKATLDRSGVLTIEGISTENRLLLLTEKSTVGTYTLGTSSQASGITYYPLNDSNNTYTTGVTKAPVSSIKISTNGTGYSTASIVATSGGSGTGLKVNITTNAAGQVIAATISVAGKDYLPGDRVVITGGNNDAELEILTTSKSGGEISITENTGNTVSGTFKFTAFNETTGDIISCRNGVFYKVPIK